MSTAVLNVLLVLSLCISMNEAYIIQTRRSSIHTKSDSYGGSLARCPLLSSSSSRSCLRMMNLPSIPPPPTTTTTMSMKSSIFLAANKFTTGPPSVDPNQASEIDPNTAGMSPDEISNYMSNVGGGLCGYPEALKSAVGLGLNVNLLVFGIFCVSYAILSALDFKNRKDVEDFMGISKDNAKSATTGFMSGGKEFKSGIRMPNTSDNEYDDFGGGSDSDNSRDNMMQQSASSDASRNAVGNRAERRLRGKK